MKLKQFYQQTHDLIQLLKVQFPHITVQMITLAFCKSTPNFIVLFGYSRILDLLLTSQFQAAIQVVTIKLVSLGCCQLSSAGLLSDEVAAGLQAPRARAVNGTSRRGRLHGFVPHYR